MREKEIIVDPDLLATQIDDLLNCDIPQDSQIGLHSLLGELLTCLETGITMLILMPGSEE